MSITKLDVTPTKTGMKVSMWAHGERLRRSLKRVTKIEARAWAETEGVRQCERMAREKARKEGRPGVRVKKTSATFADAVAYYLDQGRYMQGIEEAVKYFGAWDCRDITPEDVSDWAKGRWPGKPPSINRHGIAPVRAVLNCASEKGWCSSIRIKRVDYKMRKKKLADREWIERFIEAAKSNVRWYGLGQIMDHGRLTGHRVDELVQMRWSALTLSDEPGQSDAVIPKDKTSKGQEAHVTVPDQVVPMLRRLKEERAELLARDDLPAPLRKRIASDHVYGHVEKTNIWHLWKEVCEAAGIEYVTPHGAIRHTYATRLWKELGWDAVRIAATGRWSSPRVVQETYIHADPSAQDAADLLD